MVAEYRDIDGVVMLDPERHKLLCDGLAPWLGAPATYLMVEEQGPIYEGTGDFQWTPRPDCVNRVYVVAGMDGKTGRKVEATFRWYPEDEGRRYVPWNSDSVELGLSKDVVDLLGELARAKRRHAEWYSRQCELVAGGATLEMAPGFTRIQTEPKKQSDGTTAEDNTNVQTSVRAAA